MHYLVFKLRVTAQPYPITVSAGGHAEAAQWADVDILLVGQGSVDVTPTVA
ncbi:hypothetical protein D3C76_1569320 [compost metagenome]